MNADDNSRQRENEYGDERPQAVLRAEAGAAAWRAVVRAQQTAAPDHVDFYVLAGDLVDTLGAVASLTRVLAGQVARYGEGRAVYDDTRTVDPHDRLAEAVGKLEDLVDVVGMAADAANRFFSAIGHIGVEVAP